MISKVVVDDFREVPKWLLSLLTKHLPFSLPVLRRLQFAAQIEGGRSPNTRILFAHDNQVATTAYSSSAIPSDPLPTHFAVTYLDLSRLPETQCWLYSTLEDSVPVHTDPQDSGTGPPDLPAVDQARCLEHVLALLQRVRAIELEESSSVREPPPRPRGEVLVGSLHEAVRLALERHGVCIRATGHVSLELGWDYYVKWLFRVGEVEWPDMLPAGMRWDKIRNRQDTALVRSRTTIPRQDSTLLLLPSMAIRLDDGTLVAWAFFGIDGSLTTLHCEEPYRGRGLAKALAHRLMREHLKDYGDDGWYHADVSIRNLQSQGVCRSLGGKPGWVVSWAFVDLKTVGQNS
ncbi:hypothetical protein VTK73DRAFT_8413 [Phialemonium thermophilum]|uniref:N-acetyltransferase domain-containing protein n=1 Tax=Phialemonium thermophilum TaxID=223376 RepID=A0ABR3W8Z9_9PEZI